MLLSADDLSVPRNMDLDTCHAASPPHQLTSGRPTPEPHQYPSAREAEVQEKRDPSTWRLFAQPVTRPSRRSEIVFDQALRTAPAGIMPVWRYRQSATISFRATATIVILRIRPCSVPTRSRHHCDSSLSG